MFRLFTSIWYYSRLSLEIIYLYRISLTRQLDENDINHFVHKVIPLIEKCGCVCTKFAQWITPILDTLYNEIDTEPYWLKRLEKFYENCHDHSIDYTLQIYSQDFKEDLNDKYTIIDIIGSGSIGQVYKIKDKYTNNIYALKVLHPHVHYDMWIIKKFIRFVIWIPYTRRMIYNILPIDIPKFTELFETQLDMVHEANNLSKMKHLHNGNSMIVIPDLISCNSNILIMSYEEGKTLDESSKSDYEKYKCLCLLALFTRNSLEINNFNHGDLHRGNWKLKGDKLLIYDFGFCWSTGIEDKYINDNFYYVMETISLSNPSYLINYLSYTLNNHTDKVKQDIKDYLNTIKTRHLGNGFIAFKMLCYVAIGNNILIDPVNMLGIIMAIQTQKYRTKYGLNNENEGFETSDCIYRREYLNYLSICQTYDIYPQLQDRLKEILNKQQPDINGLFDIVDKNNTITDEIRSLLKFD